MTRQASTAQQTLVQHWDDVVAAMQKLQPGAMVRPPDGWTIFSRVDHIAGKFELTPVVFRLPENTRVGTRSLRSDVVMDLFVVVAGSITVRPDEANRKSLITDAFKTRVAYFRQRPQGLSHVYGAHCDFALNEVGHPIFHSQLRSFCEYAEYVREHYDIGGDVDEDLVRCLLQNVRVPTAQMDVFSVFLQLCADHLLGKWSGDRQKQAFDDLVKENRFLRGAASQAPHMTSQAAATCYRANHWYPAPL